VTQAVRDTIHKDEWHTSNRPRVLLTGASGHIGRHVLVELLLRNYRIRAVTSKPVSYQQRSDPFVEWVSHDFLQSVELDPLLDGCEAVLHLAAEIWRIPAMQRLNVAATAALAEAAERAGIRFFGFISSIAVYGSSWQRLVTEESPILTTERDVVSEFRGNRSIRAYGRSKILGERALATNLKTVEGAIFRPTVVVDLPDIRGIAARNTGLRVLLAKRYEHLIYVKDVADALLWFLERSLARPNRQPGVSIYNLSDDNSEIARSAKFFEHAYRLTGDRRMCVPFEAPFWAYSLSDLLKNRMISRRHPIGAMIFSPAKLLATGYRYPYGMGLAQRRALENRPAPP
jgi:nucleoside-diphosphate-sugar epimerase